MAEFDRRSVMLGAGAVALTGAAPLQQPALTNPPSAGAVPPAWTDAERITLWDGDPPGGPVVPRPQSDRTEPTYVSGIAIPELHVFRPARTNGRAILAVPGGAYSFVSIGNEGVDIARVFTQAGYTVFVLTYRLPGEGWRDRSDVPLQDAQRAMRVIRARARHYGIDPNRVAALGFSAGGHLTASLLTGYDERVYAPRDAADRESARPACGGLLYPVIAMTPPLTHAQSARLLLGPDPSPALIERRSPALHVTADTPPTFLAHALDDGAVPWQNSQLFMAAMLAAKARTEAHFFEEGGHGFGIGPANAPAGKWPVLFAAWLDRTLR